MTPGAATMTQTDWKYGHNGHHEYYERPKFCVARNDGESHWTIYHHVKRGFTRMLPNPYPAKQKLRFVQITDIPKHGERFGDRLHHDTITDTLSPNYAWDSADQAMRYVEQDYMTVTHQ